MEARTPKYAPTQKTAGDDGSLDPGSGPYKVHGRMIIGETVSDTYIFMPLELTFNLATVTPPKSIPYTGGTAPPTHP